MSHFYLVMLALAFLLVIAAEWPRLSRLLPSRARGESLGAERASGGLERPKRLKRQRVGLKKGEHEDDFAASVLRDLENLPTLTDEEMKRKL
jgi:hypothetical protein